VEEQPDGAAACGAALADGSSVEVMLPVHGVKGVILPGLDGNGATLWWPATVGKLVVSG
jgi:hypothetical protein